MLILFIPLLLRFQDLEPYPAVLFPSGANVLKVSNGTTDLGYTEVLGLRKSGKWEVIDARAFLSPASYQNLSPLAKANFGIEGFDTVYKGKFKTIKKILRFKKVPPGAGDIREAKLWLNGKLAQQGFMPNQVKIHTVTKRISLATGRIVEKIVKDEKILTFNK
ncbi:hypothetical protein [Mucilaginibacter hurinus]|uniref:hypothetical protein n=1 Tax=Mucilaginibacter hurinus TaxID=2201324 RepID=UPI0011BE5F43|nr:hypothetical protein [Mucilaginibacter hurinus]